MIIQEHINQFKDIVRAIENNDSDSIRFKQAFELCNLVFKTANFDLIKLSKDEDFALDASIELDGLVESLNKLFIPLIDQIDESLIDFKSSAKSNISNLEKLHKDYLTKQKELYDLKQTEEEYEKLEIDLNKINLEIDGYKKIDIEKIQDEIRIKTNKLDELKKEKEPLIPIWEKHLDENKKIDISSNIIEQTAEDIEQKLKEMDGLIRDEIWSNR